MVLMANDESNRNCRQSDLVWTHRSTLVHDNNVPNAGKGGASYHEDHNRRQKGLAATGLAHNGAFVYMQNNCNSLTFIFIYTGDRYQDFPKVRAGGGASNIMPEGSHMGQMIRNNKDTQPLSRSKVGSIRIAATESIKSAIATGSTNTCSPASVTFMANHVRATGSRNYVRQQQHDESRNEEASGSYIHNDKQGQISNTLGGSAQKLDFDSITRTTKAGKFPESGLHFAGFKSQKDKRQKLDVVPPNLDLPNEQMSRDRTSCLIRPKMARIDSLYTQHQQCIAQRPPQIIIRKVCGDLTSPNQFRNHPRGASTVTMENESAINVASAGVRKFHGLNHIPNISVEQGDAADWLGHAMSSTSQPAEISVEIKESKKSENSVFDQTVPDTDYAPNEFKWGVVASKTSEDTAPKIPYTTEVGLPYDSAVSYRDQVIITEAHNRNPSRISSLVLRHECCNKLNEIIKNTASDSKRAGQ